MRQKLDFVTLDVFGEFTSFPRIWSHGRDNSSLGCFTVQSSFTNETAFLSMLKIFHFYLCRSLPFRCSLSPLT
jgi:hypothetical protein